MLAVSSLQIRVHMCIVYVAEIMVSKIGCSCVLLDIHILFPVYSVFQMLKLPQGNDLSTMKSIRYGQTYFDKTVT